MSSRHKSPLWGGVCILVGAYILLVGLDVPPFRGVEAHAPGWVLLLCAVAMIACGAALCTEPRGLARRVCVACILLSMAGTGLWVSVFAPADGFSGGIPFVSRRVNVALARGLFGFGALVCLLLLFQLIARRR